MVAPDIASILLETGVRRTVGAITVMAWADCGKVPMRCVIIEKGNEENNEGSCGQKGRMLQRRAPRTVASPTFGPLNFVQFPEFFVDNCC